MTIFKEGFDTKNPDDVKKMAKYIKNPFGKTDASKVTFTQAKPSVAKETYDVLQELDDCYIIKTEEGKTAVKSKRANNTIEEPKEEPKEEPIGEVVVTAEHEDGNTDILVKEIKETDKRVLLEAKAEELGFPKFRDWAKENHKVTGRSSSGIIDDILAGKEELE